MVKVTLYLLETELHKKWHKVAGMWHFGIETVVLLYSAKYTYGALWLFAHFHLKNTLIVHYLFLCRDDVMGCSFVTYCPENKTVQEISTSCRIQVDLNRKLYKVNYCVWYFVKPAWRCRSTSDGRKKSRTMSSLLQLFSQSLFIGRENLFSEHLTLLQWAIVVAFLSICPSVCLSNAWIVTKRKKPVPTFLYHMKDHSS